MYEDYEGSRSEFLKMLAEHDSPPAFVQRAQRVEESWNGFVKQCDRHRQTLLEMPRTRLATLAIYADHDWTTIGGFVAPQDANYLEDVHQQWQPTLRGQHHSTNSKRKLRAAVRDLADSFRRFNRRWDGWLDELSFTEINFERQQYNELYLIEKACALDSDRAAEVGFEPLKDLSKMDVLQVLPMLRELSLR